MLPEGFGGQRRLDMSRVKFRLDQRSFLNPDPPREAARRGAEDSTGLVPRRAVSLIHRHPRRRELGFVGASSSRLRKNGWR